MKITKDEARILEAALNEYKYELANEYFDLKPMPALDKLQLKLKTGGIDERRQGRTSLNDFTDCFKRYITKQKAPISVTCDECLGSGWEIQYFKPCVKCNGTGTLTKN